MKGFTFDIKNNLLETKHFKAMGISVWLFMWLDDKITKIDDEGVGWVLGGKPIKYEEIKEDFNVSRRTYIRWINQLEKYPYIKAIQTPYGTSFRVFKAYKHFGKKTDVTKVAHHLDRSGTSNKTLSVDIINKDTRNSKNCVNIIKKTMDDHVIEECDDDGNSKVRKVKSSLPKVSKNKLARSLQFEFQAMAKKYLRVDVIIDEAGYFSVLRAINPEKGRMTPDQIKKMFEEWFMTQGEDRGYEYHSMFIE